MSATQPMIERSPSGNCENVIRAPARWTTMLASGCVLPTKRNALPEIVVTASSIIRAISSPARRHVLRAGSPRSPLAGRG
ncbi:MAG: hypothetical protein R3F11_17370 [Verrucomicrobiales bacterium]